MNNPLSQILLFGGIIPFVVFGCLANWAAGKLKLSNLTNKQKTTFKIVDISATILALLGMVVVAILAFVGRGPK